MTSLNRKSASGLSVRAGRVAFAAASMVVAMCAGTVWGQVRVSGLEHMPIGGATFDPPVERRLPVRNLGSSGEDGVEVRFNSRWGGAVRVDLDELLIPSPAAREIRIRPRGWDGTVKGSTRLASRPPDGTPGSSLDLDCDFAAVGATTVRVTVRDQFGNVVLNGVRAGSGVQCVVSAVADGVQIPSVRHAIKTKGTGADANRTVVMEFDGLTCEVSGLSSIPLHEVRSIEISPETCSACDTWLGTEAMLVTGSGVSQCVVSDASVGTFGVSSHALGLAYIDEECANPADCDNVRRLHVSHLDATLQDGVAIDLDDDGVGGSVSYARQCCRGHVIIMKAFDDEGGEVSRLSQVDDDVSGGTIVTCDATMTGATEMQVTFRDAGGAVLHSSRELTGVLALACTGGPEADERRCACVHGVWSLSTSVPDTYVLPDGTAVAGASSVHFYPIGGTSTGTGLHSLHFIGNDIAGPIDIRPINDPPSSVRVRGIQGVAMDKGLIAEQTDGSVIVSVPCCDDDGDSIPDGIEMRTTSAIGGTVTVSLAKLMENSSQSSREIRIRPRGWDGTVKGNIRMSSGGGGGAGGSFHVEADFADMGAVEVQWEARDVDGALLGSGTVAGSTLGGITVTPEPDATLLMPALMKAKEKANRMSCSMVMPDDDCDVTGLTPDALHNVRSIEFAPVEPAGSPPWSDLDAMQVTFSGMESLHVLDASLLTFGAQVQGIRDTQVGEVCDDGNTCDSSRKIRAENLGSSGQDGVEFRLGNPLVNEVGIGVDGASMSVARGNCCRGHVIIMKAFDDEGQEAMRMTQGSDEGGTSHTMEFDWSARGVGTLTHIGRLLDGDGNPLSSFEITGSTLAFGYVAPCDAGSDRGVRCDGNEFVVELCDGPATVFVQGMPVANVRSVSVTLAGEAAAVHSVQVTGNPTDFIEISNFAVIEGEPPCPADFDGDGTKTVADIFAFLAAWFAQQPAAYNFGGQTGVPAIFAFLSAWFAGCP